MDGDKTLEINSRLWAMFLNSELCPQNSDAILKIICEVLHLDEPSFTLERSRYLSDYTQDFSQVTCESSGIICSAVGRSVTAAKNGSAFRLAMHLMSVVEEEHVTALLNICDQDKEATSEFGDLCTLKCLIDVAASRPESYPHQKINTVAENEGSVTIVPKTASAPKQESPYNDKIEFSTSSLYQQSTKNCEHFSTEEERNILQEMHASHITGMVNLAHTSSSPNKSFTQNSEAMEAEWDVDFISKVKEYCDRRDLRAIYVCNPMAEYQQPYFKAELFIDRRSIENDNLFSFGLGRTKKLAKRIAARNMFAIIHDIDK